MSLMKKTTASIALLALTSGLFVNGAKAYSQTEVEAANRLATAGIVVPQANPADYQLDRQVLRQEIAAVARGIAKLPKTTSCANVFKDVSATKPNDWACYSVEALANAGLIAKNDKFRPESNITKAEAIGMVVKAAYGNEYNFDASKGGDWQKQVVDFAVSKGIVSQFSNYTTPATRGFIFEAADKALNGNPTPDQWDDLICKILGQCDKKDNNTNPTPAPDNKKDEKPNTNVGNGDLKVELSPESPANGYVVADSDRAVLLAFDVTAGKTDVTLKKASLKFTGLGDYKIIKNLAIYSNDVKVSKGERNFNNKLVADLSFDRDMVIKAGETKTLFVTATVSPENDTYNQTIRVSLTNIEADGKNISANLTGATLTPQKVSNMAEADVETTAATGKLFIGQEGVLYNFSVKEKSKREDLVVKTVTFEETDANQVDLDNLANLELIANNKKVDAKFTYKKSKITAHLNETVKANEKVTFVLKGTPTDDLNKTLSLKLDSVYAVGATTGIAAKSTPGRTIHTLTKTIEGTGINFTFNREGANEISAETDDVKIGELTFVTTSNYVADIQVTVDPNPSSLRVQDLLKNVEVDGDAGTHSGNVYTFKNVNLNKGTSKLPLTVDVTDRAQEGNKLKFTVKIVKLEEDSLGTKVDRLNRVLNNTQLSKEVVVRTAGLKLTAERTNITRVVPKNNQEVVLYKGRIDLNGGENITLDGINFRSTNNVRLDDYISSATLDVGGKKFQGDVNSNNINFSALSAEIQKNSKGVTALMYVTLQDKELSNVVTLEVVPEKVSVTAQNTKRLTEGTVVATNYSGLTAKASTKVNLMSASQLQTITSTNDLKDYVLAGANDVEVGAIKIKDTSADIQMNSLKAKFEVTWANTVSSAFRNIRLMDGSKQIASGGHIDGDKVVFDSFTLPQSGNDRVLKIVTDIAKVNHSGGESESFVGTIKFTDVEFETTDATVSGTTKATEEVVKVVPAVVTFTVPEKWNDGNNQATIRVTVDAGDNSLSKLTLKELKLNKSVNLSVVKVNNDSVINSITTAQNVALNKEVTNLKNFDVVVLLNSPVDGVILNKVTLSGQSTSDGAVFEFESVNEDVSLGSYSPRR